MRAPTFLLCMLLAGGGIARAEATDTRRHGEISGTPVRLVLPDDGTQVAALVVLLPDATGEQGRSEPYVTALAARGIASLVLGIEDGAEGALVQVPQSPGPDRVALAREWARGEAPLLEGRRIGVIGFGAGARVALTLADAPVVALDPGCRGLALPGGAPVLLVHGLAAPDARDCASLDGVAGLVRLGMPGIGHGWDLPPIGAPGGALLPDPAGPGRRRARPDPIAAEAAAEAVAAWLADRFAAGGR